LWLEVIHDWFEPAVLELFCRPPGMDGPGFPHDDEIGLKRGAGMPGC
jgi:hypothetical protein